MRSTIMALAAAAFLASSPAFADKGQVELGGYWGYGWLDEYGGLNPRDGSLYGGRLGYHLGSRTSLEFSAQKLSTETDFDLPIPDTDADVSAYRLNLLYHLGHGSVRPFLTAGIGSEKISVEDDGESSDFGWNAGGGLRFILSRHVNLRVDGRFVNAKASDFSEGSEGNGEANVGLSFLFGGHHEEAEAAAPEPVAQPNQAPTVTCAPDRAEVLPGETVNLVATASDPEGGPLTYEWSAAAGRVNGTGASVALDFTGATPPVDAAVTVKVTDDHSNVATSNCSVRLVAPVVKAEAVSCVAGGFPRNLSRVGNVDKACLDDVAQRLGTDPRARVVIIGHTDGGETASDLGQQRADAVKSYLVRERGIDSSRITTRSAGSAKPLGGAAAGNRRVEVWFVPQGANDPQ